MAAKEEDEGVKKKGGGWIKTGLGMVGGMLSGAVVMYFTAWLDNAVKPAKPVPNFRVEHQGCSVHFQNLSPGFTGWWDFGDGTELVPVATDSNSVDHKYDRPGDYTVKMSLKNLLNEETERSVALHVEEPAAAKQPKVVKLTAEAITPGGYAPATYKITADTQNSPLCLWDWGDARPLVVVNEATGHQERIVTFDKPHNYNVTLTAINDTLTDSQTVKIVLKDAPAGSVDVTLTAADAGTEVRTRTQPFTLSDTFRPDVKGDVSPLSGREFAAATSTDKYKDWTIRDVRLTGANGVTVSLGDQTDMPIDAAALGFGSRRNLRLQIGPDRRSMRLVGELTRGPSTGKRAVPPPALVVQGEMIEEIRKPETRTTPMPAMLQMPAAGQTASQVVSLPPLPGDWVEAQPRGLHVAVQDGPSIVAQDLQVPCRVELTLQKRRCILAATLLKGKDGKDQVRLDLTDSSGRFSAN